MSNDMSAARDAVEHIKRDNGPSRYTVNHEWQVRRDDANMNWMVYQKRQVKNPKQGQMQEKWVHTGTYHQQFGDALLHIYNKMAGRGADKRNLKQVIKHFDNIYVEVKSCTPLTPEEIERLNYDDLKREWRKKVKTMEYKELELELMRRKAQYAEEQAK